MFFLMQKTAYEMRISDGSSDVCSADLVRVRRLLALYGAAGQGVGGGAAARRGVCDERVARQGDAARAAGDAGAEAGAARCGDTGRSTVGGDGARGPPGGGDGGLVWVSGHRG